MQERYGSRLASRAASVGLPTLVSLALCAASAAAAFAHYAIDIIGDYALPHDTYDDVSHSSREVLSGIALLIALTLARRGLRACFAIATSHRGRLPAQGFSLRECVGFVLSTIAGTACMVPAMEWLDGRLAGFPVRELDDAFGGSILLGLGTAVLSACLIGAVIYALACWLVSHRDVIASIIETLRGRDTDTTPLGHALARHVHSTRRRRTAHALQRCKRGPPGRLTSRLHYQFTSTEGDSREIRSRSREAGAACTRRYSRICRAGLRATHSAAADGAAR
jgi:hypothetical protein